MASSVKLVPIQAHPRSIASTFRRGASSNVLPPSLHTTSKYLPDLENEGNDIIVIHPGSRYLRVGLASDALPKIVMNCIAHKLHELSPRNFRDPAADRIFAFLEDIEPAHLKAAVERLEDDKEMLSYLPPSKKIPANSRQQILNFNRTVEGKKIAGHDDAFNLEWTEISKSTQENSSFAGTSSASTFQSMHIVGEEALRIEKKEGFGTPRFPLKGRHLRCPAANSTIASAYSSLFEVYSDCSTIIQLTLEKELNIQKKNLDQYSAIFVIPDSCERWEIKLWLQLAYELGFKSFSLFYESVGGTFGAGVGSACVLDIGAEQTSISMVEDGFLYPDSRIELNFGGDHLSALYYHFIKYFEFPYSSASLFNVHDVALFSELKERTCSLYESDINIQVIDFLNRQPGQSTISYQFKSGEERFLVPFAFFEPSWLMKSTPKRACSVEDERIVIDKGPSMKRSKYISATNPDELPEALESEKDLPIDDAIEPEVMDSASINTAPTSFCRWKDCDMSSHPYEAPDFLSHIFNAHPVADAAAISTQASLPSPSGLLMAPLTSPTSLMSKSPSKAAIIYKCQWTEDASCSFSTPFKPAFESHLLAHFVESGLNVADAKKTGAAVPVTMEEEIGGGRRPLSLDEAILKSILTVEADPDRIRRWLGSILLVGGGHQFPGFKEMLAYKLRERAERYIKPEDRVATISNVKDVPVHVMCWKGAAIGARLEASRDNWISRVDFERSGISSFIEKFPYLSI